MRATILKMMVIALAVTHVLAHEVSAQGLPDVSQLALPGGPLQPSVTPGISGPGGDIEVVVQLSDAPLAAAHGKNAKQGGGKLSPLEERDYLVPLGRQQDARLATRT